ncbi:MAG: hypothetical protein GC192_15835 [Bacteroidetes bacterium]|nr:hypothetical protein [Bacteroidota bacterium]
MGQENSAILLNAKKTAPSPATQFVGGYPSKLSFAPLLRYWEQELKNGSGASKLLAKTVLDRTKRIPKLAQPIEDPSWLSEHSDLLELMLSPIFPNTSGAGLIGKACPPCDPTPFYQTPAWKPAFDVVMPNLDDQANFQLDYTVLNNCLTIVKTCYKQPLRLNIPVPPPVSVKDEKGMERYFRPVLNLDFIEVKTTGEQPKLGKKGIEKLLKNIYDVDAFFDALPPNKFEIHGFLAITFEEVTTETALSRINSILLRKDALKTEENIGNLETLLRSFLKFPELKIGVLPLRSDEVGGHFTIDDHCFGILNWKKGTFLEDASHSVYAKSCHFGEVVISEEINKGNAPLLKKGIQSHLVAPLRDAEGQIIGLFELGAEEAFAINSFTDIQLRKVLPQISRSLEQQKEEYANRVEAVMRQKFTAIHPSVEWRFEEVAERFLAKLDAKGKANVEPIVFKEIYPLYAQSDIVSSSLTRNHTIREDIKTQMNLISGLLKLMVKRLDFPLLRKMQQQTDAYLLRLEDEMQTSDEPFFLDFVQKEVHPLLREFSERDTVTRKAVTRYFSKLEPSMEIVYERRKAYEQSVCLINEALSELVDQADERAQRMIPHFFEKYQTDGVQFEVYAGQSLLRMGKFSEFQLNNLRLWQLQTMCEVTRRMQSLKAEMPMPLEAAQLVFVYGQPISVRFRMDEKFFDVDGAYNIRYEIIKKRIDKACILDSEERLTQPDKIAIVYATDPMRQLYLEFCQFLVTEGQIEPEIEELELERLQETQGLKALRIKVKSKVSTD